MSVHEHISELIGGTPLLRLSPDLHGLPEVDLYAKLELLNPWGSVKDRTAWGMLAPHVDTLRGSGRQLIEASSGNTAKALQVLASLHGTGLRVLSNRARVPEIRDLLRLLGAELEDLPGLSECPDPTVPDDAFSRIERRMASEPGRYLHLSQYTNPDNVAVHRDTTAAELLADLGRVDHLFGGLGTSGSTRGTAESLRQADSGLHAVAAVSAAGDVIPGIRAESEMWEVGLFDASVYAGIEPVSASDAIDASVLLARRAGVLAGPSSGAAYLAALRHLRRCPPASSRTRRTAVVILSDRLEPYLGYIRDRRPDLFSSDPFSSDPAASGGSGDPGATTPRPVTAAEAAQAPVMTVAELGGRLADPGILIVDTRSSLAFRIGHIPGALNFRQDLLEQAIAAGPPFPTGREVVLTCPAGEAARPLAVLLRRQGIQAVVLEGGVIAWREAGRELHSA